MSDKPKPSPGISRIRAVRDAAREVAPPPTHTLLGGGPGGGGGAGGAGDVVELVDPKAPLRIARQLVARDFERDGETTLRHWRGDFYRHQAGAYRQTDEQEVRNHTALFLERCRKLAGDSHTEPCKPNTRMVANVVDMMKAVVPLTRDTEPPCWLPDATPFATPRPAAQQMIPVANGLLHAPTGRLWPPTPGFFATTVSPVSYSESAKQPVEWLRFLKLLWPNDPQSIEVLQEWFGYCLTGDTSRQKILLIVGPPRSGKGTIARILSLLLGVENVCGPTLDALGSAFGLAPLIGKTLATVADARLGKKSDRSAIVECLLRVSGEDIVTIDRKHQLAWSGRLRARFMVMTNELPELGDASGAFPSRLVVLQLTRSFLGKEDLGLGDRLELELPSILLWAVEGWQRLAKRGRFVQPESATDALGALRDTSSDMGTFVRDYCDEGDDHFTGVDYLYRAHLTWRKTEGIEGSLSKSRFGSRLRSVCPRVKVSQPRAVDGGRSRIYLGIRLTTEGERRLIDAGLMVSDAASAQGRFSNDHL